MSMTELLALINGAIHECEDPIRLERFSLALIRLGEVAYAASVEKKGGY